MLLWVARVKIKRVLYIHHYGDQHGNTNVTISDGGSNIHIHLIKKLEKKFKVIISTYADNYVSNHYFSKSKNVTVVEHPTVSGILQRNVLFFEMFLRCFYPGLKYLFVKDKFDYVVTQTDFFPDVLTGLLIKMKSPKMTWVASYFLDAPKPWDKNSPYKGKRYFIGLFYWLLQRPAYWIIRRLADFVLVTSRPDVAKFITTKRDLSRVIVAQGGVDIEDSEKYLRSETVVPVSQRKYDACFVGRFHYQKGILELVDIWKTVTKKKPNARLAMIGTGPLESDLVKKIKRLGLEKRIDLLGYQSGEGKFATFRQSKVIVHPASYDSGGMAAAEGMAWGLPGVGFDLEALKKYYPKGMFKAPVGDIDKFAENVLLLLNNKVVYNRLANEAYDLIKKTWDWKVRVKHIYKPIFR